MHRTIVCGWFSVEGGEATAGDLLAMEVVTELAAEAGQVDLATNEGFPDGLDWRSVDPEDYDQMVFVCGPLTDGAVAELVDRFRSVRTVAVNVSVIDHEVADRFDVVVPRDGEGRTQPDLTFSRRPPSLPVVGVVRSHRQPEYPVGRHRQVHDAIRLVLASRPCATVEFGTRVHPGADPLRPHARSVAEVTSLASRMDAIVSTRLHGLVLGLGQSTPVLAVDPIAGGAKVRRQARRIGWPCVFTPEAADPEHLSEALTWCLGEDARREARACRQRAEEDLRDVRREIARALGATARS